MWRSALCVSVAALAAPAWCAQRRTVFAFDSRQIAAWNSYYHVNVSPTRQAPHPYSGSGVQVTINGNFGGTFNVSGPGNGTSSRGDNNIDVSTNASLTFTATNFTTLHLSGADASSAGSIAYQMQLFAGTSSSIGSAISSSVGGTDAGFNGASLTLTVGQIPSGGNLVFKLSRTLSLSSLAIGGQTYTATGTIVVTIN